MLEWLADILAVRPILLHGDRKYGNIHRLKKSQISTVDEAWSHLITLCEKETISGVYVTKENVQLMKSMRTEFENLEWAVKEKRRSFVSINKSRNACKFLCF